MRNASLITSLSLLLGRQTLGPFVLYAIGLLVAAWTDVRARKIANWVTVPLIACGLFYNAHLAGWSGAGHSFAGLGIGVGVLFVPFMARAIGGGDVKLLGAIGAWVGSAHIWQVALWSAALTGVLVVLLLVRNGALRRQVATNLKASVLTQQVIEVEARPNSHSVPVGAALAAAGLWVAVGQGGFPGA